MIYAKLTSLPILHSLLVKQISSLKLPSSDKPTSKLSIYANGPWARNIDTDSPWFRNCWFDFQLCCQELTPGANTIKHCPEWKDFRPAGCLDVLLPLNPCFLQSSYFRYRMVPCVSDTELFRSLLPALHRICRIKLFSLKLPQLAVFSCFCRVSHNCLGPLLQSLEVLLNWFHGRVDSWLPWSWLEAVERSLGRAGASFFIAKKKMLLPERRRSFSIICHLGPK